VKTSLQKLIRTVQSELYFLKRAKDALYFHSRRLLRRPSEDDFCALRFIPEDLPGCFVDVGANHGQSIESIRLFKPRSRIVAFEANEELARKLQRRYADDPAITVHAHGLADERQSRVLFVPVYKGFVYDGLASFDRESAAMWLGPQTLFFFSPRRLKLRESRCTTERLDEQGLDPLFIKIDVQGFEYQVIRGGLETIRCCDPILMIEALQSSPPLVELTRRLGYRQYLFDETGFYPSDAPGALNSILMTPRRAGAVTRSRRID